MNRFFYILLFLGFCLPSNSSLYLSFPGVQIQIREIAFLLLPFINRYCVSQKGISVIDIPLKRLILFLFIFLVVNEGLKAVYYGEGLGTLLKTIRIGLPMFSSLIMLYTGFRADIEKVWATLLSAVSTSAVLTLISPVIDIPIYDSLDGEDFLESTEGRLMNANASFGILGVYLLYSGKKTWYSISMRAKLAALLSVLVLIASFNRTYLFLLSLSILYLSYVELSLKKIGKLIAISVVSLLLLFSLYNSSAVIKNQVDKRIIDVVVGNTLLTESVYENNRDIIYSGIEQRLREGYWLFGLPYGKGFFSYSNSDGYVREAVKSDISLINVLLRYGLVVLILFLGILKVIYTGGSAHVRFTLIMMLLASLNIDALMAHNSIFFLIVLIFVCYHKKN